VLFRSIVIAKRLKARRRTIRDAVTAIAAGGSPPVLRNTIAAQIFPDLRFPQTR